MHTCWCIQMYTNICFHNPSTHLQPHICTHTCACSSLTSNAVVIQSQLLKINPPFLLACTFYLSVTHCPFHTPHLCVSWVCKCVCCTCVLCKYRSYTLYIKCLSDHLFSLCCMHHKQLCCEADYIERSLLLDCTELQLRPLEYISNEKCTYPY